MAKKSAIARNKKIIKIVEQYSKRRKELKTILNSSETSDEEFYLAQNKLAKLPRNSSAVRIRNRCRITGRPRAYHRKLGLSRITLRELALIGAIPGMTKSSW